MIKTDPIVQEEDMSPGRSLPSERSHMAKPQIFVNLEFGVSWSQRHTPRTHAITYTSRNLRDARDRGAFPRQLPPTNTNYLASLHHQQQWQREIGEHRHQARQHYQQHQQVEQPQQSSRRHQQPQQYHLQPTPYNNTSSAQHQPSRQPEWEWARDSLEQSQETVPEGQGSRRRESRSESRGLSHERGNSAPPPFSDSPWDATPGASLFPPPQAAATTATATSASRLDRPQDEPRIWKPLPEAPGRFRLGEDGLPWSAFAWPIDPHGPEEDPGESAYASQLSPVDRGSRRSRAEDPAKATELESLSAAMMTVDNGFESQWWYQGPREPVPRFSRDQEEPHRLSMADAQLLSAAEPMSAVNPPPEGWYAPTSPAAAGRGSYDQYSGGQGTVGTSRESINDIVSPISTLSASPQQYRPLHRTLTTRSEELFFGR
ncbi:hypothetical protein PGQ11_015162 [Apiospora arundinis]|uniref:Uncharacterized protein n=1 Tax=Apiospora arundinis TaxID=335852 RepID=A0ABR2HKJ7_9PEZI